MRLREEDEELKGKLGYKVMFLSPKDKKVWVE